VSGDRCRLYLLWQYLCRRTGESLRRRGLVTALAVVVALAAGSWAQTTSPFGTTSTNTPGLNVNLGALQANQSPFQGSIPTGAVQPGVMQLSLRDAIERGLKYNLGLYDSDQARDAARAARLKNLGDLLPNLSAHTSETVQQINLATLGLPANSGFPAIVGPFSVFDVRAAAGGPIFDLHAINKVRAGTAGQRASQYDYSNSRELTVVAVGIAYVQALASGARVDAVEAQLRTAETLFQLASDQKAAGVAPAIDVLRSQVEMQSQQQRLVAARNDFDKQKLQLARVIGLPTGQQFALSEKIPHEPLPPITLEDAITRALNDRPDYAAAKARLRAAQLTRDAATGERIPSLRFDADYGDIGKSPGTSHGTFSTAASLMVPIFAGGRIKGDIVEADSALRQREAQAADLRGRIEYEVRTAFLDLQATAEQLKVAQSTLGLSQETLTQAQDRFRAGVTNNIEVVQAQEAVATSNESLISSELEFNLAKLALVRSLGVAERATKEFLGGRP